jgi:acetamidase/formamidase
MLSSVKMDTPTERGSRAGQRRPSCERRALQVGRGRRAEPDHSAEEAYVLASLCVDLKISEIVDAGQFVVSALLPLNVFSQA